MNLHVIFNFLHYCSAKLRQINCFCKRIKFLLYAAPPYNSGVMIFNYVVYTCTCTGMSYEHTRLFSTSSTIPENSIP